MIWSPAETTCLGVPYNEWVEMVMDAAYVELCLSSCFLGVRTNTPVAVLQLFRVCKESESLYPPDLNGSKVFYCTKPLNFPQSSGE